jgi:hypothetical protein
MKYILSNIVSILVYLNNQNIIYLPIVHCSLALGISEFITYAVFCGLLYDTASNYIHISSNGSTADE